MKDLKDSLSESLITESSLNKKELDDECEGQDMVTILKGNNFNFGLKQLPLKVRRI